MGAREHKWKAFLLAFAAKIAAGELSAGIRAYAGGDPAEQVINFRERKTL